MTADQFIVYGLRAKVGVRNTENGSVIVGGEIITAIGFSSPLDKHFFHSCIAPQ